ncbi:MAG: hypothetical protein LC769_02830 [Chloroflexi bacterium]|nr:hypothetical protein [Chloroflexota bacterium]
MGAWPRSCCIAEKALTTAGATIPLPDDLDEGAALTLSIPASRGRSRWSGAQPLEGVCPRGDDRVSAATGRS